MSNPLPSSEELKELLDLAVNLSSQAGKVHLRRHTGDVDSKSTATDPVSQVDRDAEQIITAGIGRARPDDGILGEEGTDTHGNSGFRWVIDPLDGTVNYLYGFPSHSVSIAVELDGVPIIGVVFDTAHDEMYVAQIDGATTKNGDNVQVTSCQDLSFALIGTGFGYDPDLRKQQALILAEFLPLVRDIRRAGSCAIDLCSVASGRLDGFYETGVQWWDVAAGIAIVRSAGGMAVYEPLHKRVIASGPLLWEQLCGTVNEAEIAVGSQKAPPSANI